MELTQETIFCDIKECLLLFNYPLAHCMSDNELGDVFHASNRCFLVSWMLKLYLGDVYQNTSDVIDKETNAHLLGDLLYKLGFCMEKQRQSFMKGDLDLNAQIDILYKVFKSIKSVKSSTHQECTNPITFEEMMILSHNELNLFPMYGDIRMSNSVESSSDTMGAIHLLTNEDNTIINEVGHVEIKTLIEQVREELANIKSLSKNIPETTDINEQDQQTFVYNPESSKILKSCVDHAKQISQIFEDINTIGRLKKYNDMTQKEWECMESSQNMLRALYEEIVVTLRYQQMKLP